MGSAFHPIAWSRFGPLQIGKGSLFSVRPNSLPELLSGTFSRYPKYEEYRSRRMSRIVSWTVLATSTIYLVGCTTPANSDEQDVGLETTQPIHYSDATNAILPDSSDAALDADGLDGILPGSLVAADGVDGVLEPTPCPTGHLHGPVGNCMPIGIQGCVDLFLEEDGLCHPRIEKCPAGTIPKFDEGCIPVGIQGCADLFMEGDGLCHPRMDKCPLGTIPKFDEGCVHVGIQDCADLFIEEDGLCHPSMEKCPDGTFAVPSQGCLPIDGPGGCGEGTWGGISDGPNTIYVEWGKSDIGATGTKADPFGTIAEALQAVPAGGRIALSAGTYEEPLKISKPITLIGRCPSMVRLEGSQPSNIGLPVSIWIISAGVDLRDLQIGGAGIGVFVDNVSDTSLDSVWIHSASIFGTGVVGPNASLSLTRCLIEDTQPEPNSGGLGRGVSIESGAKVLMEQCAVVGNREAAIDVSGAATGLEAYDSLIEGTLPQESDQMFGQGVAVYFGAAALLTSNAIVGNADLAVGVQTDGTELTAANNLIENTHAQESDLAHGGGITVAWGATSTLVSNAVLGNRTWGIWLADVGTADVRGNLIMGTQPREADGDFGIGLILSDGIQAVVEDNVLAANHVAGLYAYGGSATTMLEANFNLAEGTLSGLFMGEDAGGHGFKVADGAEAHLTGNAAQGNHLVGILFDGTLTDGTADWNHNAGSVSSEQEFGSGWGIDVYSAAASLSHNSIVGDHSSGIRIYQSLSAILEGNLVLGAPFSIAEGMLVTGMKTYGSSPLVLDNAIVGSQNYGIETYFSGSSQLEGNIVQGTLAGNQVGVGGGMYVHASSAVVTGTAFIETTGVGVAIASQDDFESNLNMAESLVVGTTQGATETGLLGVGALLQTGSKAQFESSLFAGNTTASLFVWDSEASVKNSMIANTQAGQFMKFDSQQLVTEVGDGILSLNGSTTVVANSIIRDNQRAGILSDSSSGKITTSESAYNQFGVVLQGTPKPEVLADNSLHDNSQKDMISDGDFVVPDQPLQMPSDAQ